MSVELRSAPADGPDSRALFAAYLVLLEQRVGASVAEREDIVATAGAFSGPGSAWLVAYDGDRPVGCGGLRPLDARRGEIKRMFVTAGARGRGHGRALLTELERRAAEAGQRRVRLLTTEVLHEARALYAGAGYRVVETRLEGARRDYWMEKELGAS